VSTRAHANKKTEMSHGEHSSSIRPDRLSVNPSDPCKRPRAILKSRGKVCVLILVIACVDFCKSLCILYLSRSSLCVKSLSQSHNHETILSLLILFGNPVSVFPIGCCGHAMLDCMWLVRQYVKHSLQVREVIEVGRIGCLACE
jgi:hypothetical protein